MINYVYRSGLFIINHQEWTPGKKYLNYDRYKKDKKEKLNHFGYLNYKVKRW